MDIKEMVIEVNGLPDNYPENILIDKLTIHFLRRRNKGGDVLTVLYPTTNKGQAYVVFETEDVPGVLQHTHVLEVDSQFYPLDVKKMDQPLRDMPAEAFLDIKMFASPRKIHEVLHSHGFQVSETRSGQLHLQGSFLNLELIYPKLMQLLAEETHSQKVTPSHYMNGHSDYRAVSRTFSSDNDYKSRSNVTLRHSHKNDSMYSMGGSTSSGMNSGSSESKNKWAFLQAASQVDEKSSTESSFSSPSRNYDDSNTIDQQWNPSSHTHSLLVEPYVLTYIRQFKEDLIEKIKSDHHTHISYSVVDSEFAQVNLSRGAYKEAAEELGELMQNIALSLRTQEIDLDKLDKSHKKGIIQKANSFQKIYSVLIRLEGNIIKVIGSSKDSHEAKQRLLGEKVEIALPKPMERNLLRRSSSLPREKSTARMENLDLKQSPETMYTTTASSHQMNPELQQEVQQERGLLPSKSSAQRGRSQSTNRLKHKTENKVNQEPLNYNQQDLTTSNKVQKKPKILPALIPAFKNKFKFRL